MARYVNIALVSYPPLPAQTPDRLPRTLEAMGQYVGQAAQMGAQLVAFPEICNHLGDANVWQFEPLDGPTVHAMAAAASQHGIYVVCPLATIEDGTRYNSSVLLDRQGNIAGVYHKNVPTHGELDVAIMPGTETPVFETDFGRVGLTICFDLNYWEVGASLCANRPELVIWSSMWTGARMLTKWSIEFGFHMGAVYSGCGSFVDAAGREILSIARNFGDVGGVAPIVMASLDLDQRLLHHDGNLPRIKALTAKRGPTAIQAEWLPHECLLVISSRLPGVSTDELIAEAGLETMRDYLARVRRDRQAALAGTYKPRPKP
jgi:predicted amidohydrolase